MFSLEEHSSESCKEEVRIEEVALGVYANDPVKNVRINDDGKMFYKKQQQQRNSSIMLFYFKEINF